MGKGANGQTIMREIVTPKNPRSNAQLMQRAIMATVMQAYAAGKVIFDHSFQGKSVGAQNQHRFMSINARRLRTLIADEINNNVQASQQKGRVVGPGVASPTPCPLQISEGTLVNTLMVNTEWTPALAQETLSAYCTRLGLVKEDLFTFVAFYTPEGASALFEIEGESSYQSKQYATQFIWARYKVKESAFTSTSPVMGSTLADLLEQTEGNFTPQDCEYTGDLKLNLESLVDYNAKGVCAWIRSRFDEGLRSNESMVIDNNDFGISSSFALAAWKQGATSLGDSELILEGGDL